MPQEAARAAGLGIWSAPPLPITGPTPAPAEASLPRLVRADPITIYSSAPTRLSGVAGVYTWRSVGFADANVQLTWDVQGVRDPILRIRLAARTLERGRARVDDRRPRARPRDGWPTVAIDFTDAAAGDDDHCPDWSFSMQGTATP